MLEPEFIVSLDNSQVLAAVTDREWYDHKRSMASTITNHFSITTISRWEIEIGDSIIMTQDLKKIVDLKLKSDVTLDSVMTTNQKGGRYQVSIPTIAIGVSTFTLFTILITTGILSLRFPYYNFVGLFALIILNLGIFTQDMNGAVAE